MDYDFTYTGAEIQAILDTAKKLKDSGYIFLGVATPSTNPGTPTQKVYYEAKQAGTYTNFGGVVLPDGISLLKWNGSWTSETVMCGDGGVFDISVYKSSGGTLAKYTDLAAALGTNGANIPQSLRKGGMSVKFVQSSDNKYVQYRLMPTSFSTTPSDWQEVGDLYKIVDFGPINQIIKELYIDTSETEIYVKYGPGSNNKHWLVFYDSAKTTVLAQFLITANTLVKSVLGEGDSYCLFSDVDMTLMDENYHSVYPCVRYWSNSPYISLELEKININTLDKKVDVITDTSVVNCNFTNRGLAIVNGTIVSDELYLVSDTIFLPKGKKVIILSQTTSSAGLYVIYLSSSSENLTSVSDTRTLTPVGDKIKNSENGAFTYYIADNDCYIILQSAASFNSLQTYIVNNEDIIQLREELQPLVGDYNEEVITTTLHQSEWIDIDEIPSGTDITLSLGCVCICKT